MFNIIYVFAVHVIKILNEQESQNEKFKRMTDQPKHQPKLEGIGPTTKDGMPIVLRSVRILNAAENHYSYI